MRKTVLTALMLTVCTLIAAAAVGRREAMQKAAALFGNTAPVELVAAAEGSEPAYYVFNVQRSRQGFVIVSGEDQGDILGYSDTGAFDPADVPPAVRYWLQCYEEQVAEIRAGRATPYRAAVAHKAVEPLVRTQWNQNAPYNSLLPTNPLTGEHFTATGCVATMLAQLLRYWAVPKPTAGIPAYSYYLSNSGLSYSTEQQSGYQLVSIDSLPSTTFNYDLLQDTYTSADAGTASGAEVARLMQYCGRAVKMKYMSTESSASIGGSTLADYFGFSPYSQYTNRNRYSAAEWDELVYADLAAGRPVIYRGAAQSATGSSGHIFLCDGYRDGLYHINWGWGGHYDGYFKLSEMNPRGTGTGGSNGYDGYSIDQAAVFGVQPEPAKLFPSNLYVKSMVSGISSQDRVSTNSSFSAFNVTASTYSMAADTCDYVFGLALCRGDELVATYEGAKATLAPNYGYNKLSQSVVIDRSVADGVYALRCVNRVNGSSRWQFSRCSDQVYLKVTVSGTTMDIESVTPTSHLQVNSVDYEGTLKKGSLVTAKASVTNLGNMPSTTVYLFADGQLATGIGVNLDPGQTDDVLLHFEAPLAGTLPLVLCYDNQGLQPFWSGTLDIADRREPHLSAVGNVSVANTSYDYNEKTNVIEGTSFSVSALVKNNDSQPFDDVLRIVLYRVTRVEDGRYWGSSVAEQEVPCTIAAGGQETVSCSFDDLDVGEKYWVNVMVFSPASNAYTTLKQTSVYQITAAPSGIRLVGTDGTVADGRTPVYDLHGRRLGTAGDVLSKGVYVVKGRKFVVR